MKCPICGVGLGVTTAPSGGKGASAELLIPLGIFGPAPIAAAGVFLVVGGAQRNLVEMIGGLALLVLVVGVASTWLMAWLMARALSHSMAHVHEELLELPGVLRELNVNRIR